MAFAPPLPAIRPCMVVRTMDLPANPEVPVSLNGSAEPLGNLAGSKLASAT
jgi:hypothetical protein